jgi:hypothetical protein
MLKKKISLPIQPLLIVIIIHQKEPGEKNA